VYLRIRLYLIPVSSKINAPSLISAHYNFATLSPFDLWHCWLMLLRLKIETEADEDESEGSDSEGSDALDLSKITEMRLVPSNPSQCSLQSFFPFFLISFSFLIFNAKLTAILSFYIFWFYLACWYWWSKTNFVTCVIVDTLFDIFCQCAELNPEPIDGE
jgi:hypothetical protein